MSMNAFELFGVLKLDRSEYDKEMSKVESDASGFGKGLAGAAKVGLAAVGAASAAVVGFGASAVKTGSQFDAAMGGVAATLGKSMDEMEGQIGEVDTAYGHFSGTLRDFAQYMGKNTTFSATQAAEALNYMALAGYDTQKSMDMLPAVLDMAAAGGMELARASDMITDTQSALGLDMERTTQMVNEFAKAASTGNTSVEQIGDAFLRVGGLAAELNGGFVTLEDGTKVATDGTQELEIAFTAMANAGVKGAEAGTHMRNMLLKLSSPTKDGVEALEKMGISVFDAEGKMRSLSEIFGDLSTAMSTMTQEEKIQTISDLFNTRDLASAESLLAAVGQDWDRIGESILQADGAATEMAKTKLDNLTGDVTLFNSALESAQIAINDKLSPTLRDFVQFGTQGMQTFTDALQEGGLSGAVESLGTILSDGLSMVIEKLPDIVAMGTKMLGAFLEGLLDATPQIWQTALQLLELLWDGIMKGLPELTNKAVEIIRSLADGIRKNFPEMIKTGMAALMEFSGSLRENIGEIVDAGLDLIMALAEGLIDGLPVFIETIPTIITNIAGIINDNMPKILIMGVKIIAMLAVGLIKAIPVLIKELPKIIKAIVDVFMAFNWLNLGKSIITAIGDGIKAVGKSLPTMFKNIGKSAIEFFKSHDWIGAGKYAITWILKGLRALMSKIPSLFKTIGQNAVKMLKNIDWVSLGKNIILGIVDGLLAFASKIGDTLLNIGKGAFENVKNFFGIESPSKKFKYIGEMIGAGMVVGIDSTSGDVDNAINGLYPDTGIYDNISGRTSTTGLTGSDSVLAQMGDTKSNNGDMTVILELDRVQFAKAIYKLNRDEEQRVGVNLAGGFA